VAVAAGATAATFTITSAAVSSNQIASISATTSSGGSADAMITLVARFQSTSTSQISGQTASQAFPGDVTAGDLLIVGTFVDLHSYVSAADSQGNTFTQVAYQTVIGQHKDTVLVATALSSGPDTVTVNVGSGKNVYAFSIHEYSDVTTTVDAMVTAQGNSGSPASGNLTTANPNDLIFAWFTNGSNFNNENFDSLNSAYTKRELSGTGTAQCFSLANCVESADQFTSTTLTTNATATLNVPDTWSATVIAFQASASVAGQSGAAIAELKHSQSGVIATGEVPAQAPVLASGISTLLCLPNTVAAGAKFVCRLQVTASPDPIVVHLSSDSSQLEIPQSVTPRPNQSSLSFQGNVKRAASGQLVTVTASSGDSRVADTFMLAPASGPVLEAPANRIAKIGKEVSFPVSAVEPSQLEFQVSAQGLPTGATFDVSSGRFDWVPSATQAGKHQVTFTATNSAGQTTAAQVTIDVTSGTPTVAPAGQICSPGAVEPLSGSWLSDPGTALSDPSGNSTDLGGTKVKVDGQYVAVLSASPTEVHFVCPSASPGTQIEVGVETANGVSEPLSMAMRSASPWIFSLDVPGPKQGVASFVGTTELAMVRNAQVAAHPAQPGDEILLWGTGFGTSGEDPSGTVSVKIGGVDAQVESVNAVPGQAGVYTVQFRVPVPMVFGEEVPAQLQVTGSDGKVFNSNNVTIAVEPAMH